MKNKIRNLKVFSISKNEPSIIATHDLGKYILANKSAPIPLYAATREYKRGKVKIKF